MRTEVAHKSSEIQSLAQRIKQNSVVLSDLDGLLVNSENFNQVFVHRTNRAWMESTISRIVKSDLHLRKFLQVLVKFITSERHPEWARHALVWLRYLLSTQPISPSTWPSLEPVLSPLLTHSNELAGLHDLYMRSAMRGTAMERWAARHSIDVTSSLSRLFYDSTDRIPTTGYVFFDDSDVEDLPCTSRKRLRPRGHSADVRGENILDKGDEGELDSASLRHVDGSNEINDGDLDGSLLLDDDGDISDVDEYDEDQAWGDFDEDAEEDESEDHLDLIAGTPSESDHGVFDVNEIPGSVDSSHGSFAEGVEDEEQDVLDSDEDNLSDLSDHVNKDVSQEGHHSDLINSDSDSVVSETSSESDEETKYLLLAGKQNLGTNQNSDDEEGESGSPLSDVFPRSGTNLNLPGTPSERCKSGQRTSLAPRRSYRSSDPSAVTRKRARTETN